MCTLRNKYLQKIEPIHRRLIQQCNKTLEVSQPDVSELKCAIEQRPNYTTMTRKQRTLPNKIISHNLYNKMKYNWHLNIYRTYDILI